MPYQYYLTNHSIDYDDPSFKIRYGSQFKEGASSYEESHSLNEDFSKALALTIKKALESFTTVAANCALEVGCGTGVLTRGCNHHGVAQYFIATDISERC